MAGVNDFGCCTCSTGAGGGTAWWMRRQPELTVRASLDVRQSVVAEQQARHSTARSAAPLGAGCVCVLSERTREAGSLTEDGAAREVGSPPDGAPAHLVHSEPEPLHEPLLEHRLRGEHHPQHGGDTVVELALGHALLQQGAGRIQVGRVSVDRLFRYGPVVSLRTGCFVTDRLFRHGLVVSLRTGCFVMDRAETHPGKQTHVGGCS